MGRTKIEAVESPFDHCTVPEELLEVAFRTTESPAQMVVAEAEILISKTSIEMVSEQVTPFTVRSTQYEVVSEGLTQTESPVSPVDQVVVEGKLPLMTCCNSEVFRVLFQITKSSNNPKYW